MVTFFVLNIMVFYYEWRLGLYLLGNWPFALIGNMVLQQVILYTYMCIIIRDTTVYRYIAIS